jgi:hypothetical protein
LMMAGGIAGIFGYLFWGMGIGEWGMGNREWGIGNGE